MKRWIKALALVALFLGTTSLALADIPSPNNSHRSATESSKPKVQMQIETDEEATEARLLIPRSVLRQLQAGLDGNDSQNAGSSHFLSNLSGAQTAMAGLFLSLAFMFGGVWLVRSRGAATNKLTRAALGMALLALCGATASIAYANAGPPPVARSLTSKILLPELQWWGAYGQVKVEIVDDKDQITLVLPRTKEQPK